MIEWRKVTEAEPEPGHDDYVLLLRYAGEQCDIKVGWRNSCGEFRVTDNSYDEISPYWWALISMPGGDCNGISDEKEDRVSALEAAHARLVERVTALEYAREATGGRPVSYKPLAAEIDATRAENARMKKALLEIENLAAGLTWLASTDALHRAQEIARNALREGEQK